MQTKKHLILMMGGQGVGKGSLSKMLMDVHPFKYIETGAILRSMPPDSEIGRIVAQGHLVTDDILFDIMNDKLSGDHDIILDGFPRKISQAKWLIENYADIYNIHVLYLSAPESVLIARINKRIGDGGGRADDACADIIRRRLDNYLNMTIPAIDWLRTVPNIKFSQIDACGTKDENMQEIMKVLVL